MHEVATRTGYGNSMLGESSPASWGLDPGSLAAIGQVAAAILSATALIISLKQWRKTTDHIRGEQARRVVVYILTDLPSVTMDGADRDPPVQPARLLLQIENHSSQPIRGIRLVLNEGREDISWAVELLTRLFRIDLEFATRSPRGRYALLGPSPLASSCATARRPALVRYSFLGLQVNTVPPGATATLEIDVDVQFFPGSYFRNIYVGFNDYRGNRWIASPMGEILADSGD